MPDGPLRQFYRAQIEAVETDVRADDAAASIVAQARVGSNSLVSQTNVGIAESQAETDVAADSLRVQGQAAQVQETTAGEVQAASIVAGFRVASAQVLDAARTAAAQLLATARIQSSYTIAAARVSAETITAAAEVAATQVEATARVAAVTATSAADVQAAQLSSTARLSALGVDWSTRITTAGILIAARVAGAQVEADAQVTHDQGVAAAEVASNQVEATARLAADTLVAGAHITAAGRLATARVAAASTEADAEIAVATTEAAAAYAAATTETNAQLTIVGLDPGNYVADLELEAVTYEANQGLAAREYAASAAYAGGSFAADQSYVAAVYRSTQQLVGAQYASDRDTVTTEAVAATRSAADRYVATDQLAGVEYAINARLGRYQQTLTFVEALFEEVWPIVSGALDPLPDAIQTPGVDLAHVPAIAPLEALDAPTLASIVQAACGTPGVAPTPPAATRAVVVPVPLRFYLASPTDHASPASASPSTLLIWNPGLGAWTAPVGPLLSTGNGYWTVAPAVADQGGGLPLLIFAQSSDSDPTAAWSAGSMQVTAGVASQPLPFWLGTTASSGYAPATGLSPTVVLSPPGPGGLGLPFAAGLGSVTEAGHGWYLYWPMPGETADSGPMSMLATATAAVDWAWTYAIAPAAQVPGTIGTLPAGGVIPGVAATEASLFTGPLAAFASSWITLDGAAASLGGQYDLSIRAAEANGKQLAAANAAFAERFDQVNRVAVLAEANLIGKTVGLLAGVPRLVNVAPGG